MFVRYVSRNQCFSVSLTTWVMAVPLLVEYAVVRHQPQFEWYPTGLFIGLGTALACCILSWFLEHRVPFFTHMRDSLCSWGTGYANATTYAYMVLLPIYVVIEAFGWVAAAKELQTYEADAPARARRERQEKIESIRAHLRIGEEEAAALCDEFDGDEVKAITQWRLRQSAGTDAAGGVPSAAASVGTIPGQCPKCARQTQPGKPLCVYCGTRLVAKVECPGCHLLAPPGKPRCQYCGASMTAAQ